MTNWSLQNVWNVLAAVILGMTTFCPLQLANAASQNDNKIRVAINLPLTGPIAAFCAQYPKAFEMGVEDGCKQYVVPRDAFIIDVQDNSGKPSQAVTVCRKQLMDKPSIYISGTSPMSLPIAAEINEHGIPHIILAFDAFLCRNGTHRLRFLPNYKTEGPVYLDYVRARNAKRVFVINCNLSSSNEQFDKIVLPQLSTLGAAYQNERYDFNTKDFRSIGLKVAQYKPDLIILGGCYSVHLYPLISALRTYGLIRDANVITTLDLIDLLHNRTNSGELTGIAFVAPDFEIPGVVKESKAWAERYKQKFQQEPSYVESYAYDTGKILTRTYKRFGKVDDTSIRSTLPFRGVSGEITIDKDGDLNSKLHVAEVMSNGAIQQIDQ